MASKKSAPASINADGNVAKVDAESIDVARDLIVSTGISDATLNKILDAVRNPGPAGPTLKAKSNFADADIRWNRFFTGREEDLARLHTALAGASQAISHTIWGAGGVGKTELARAFAFTFSDEYDGVWWIDASDAGFSNAIIRAYKAATGTPAAADAKPAGVARELRVLWSKGRHLVILDNLDSYARLELFPPDDGFRVLATTRIDLSGAATIRPFKVDVLSEDAAVELLRKQTTERTPPHLESHLRAIARVVDCHTLAVALAGAYLAKYKDVAAADYPAMLSGKGADGGTVPSEWGESDPLLLKYYHSIRSCLSLHFDKFDGKPEMMLLRLASFCSPTAIPLDILAKAAGVDIQTARVLARNLADVSVIDYQTTLSLHRLTQMVVRSMIGAETQGHMIEAVVETLDAEFAEPEDHTKWLRLSVLAAHADAVVVHAAAGHATPAAGNLANRLGMYLRQAGRYADAQRTFNVCLDLTAKTSGAGHLNMGTALANLASIQRAQGDLPGALASMEQAIVIQQKHFAQDHPAFVIRWFNLATIQHDQKDFAGALASMLRVIAIQEKNYAPDDPTFAASYSNLARILHDQHDLPGARESIERAIAIQKKHFDADHPTFAISYSNLARIQQDQHDLPGARENIERAIAIQEKHFAPDHPAFAIRWTNLGAIDHAEGKKAAACANFQKALAIDLKHFGEDHPHTKIVRGWMKGVGCDG